MSRSNSGTQIGHYDSSLENNRKERSLTDAEREEFAMPVGDGVIKVIISGMGSTASLTAVGIEEHEEHGRPYPRVNSRNCSSTSMKLNQCTGSKLNFLGVGVLSTTLGTPLGPVPSSSACQVTKAGTGYGSIEDISTLSPVLPSQLRASEESHEHEDEDDDDENDDGEDVDSDVEVEVEVKISGSKRTHTIKDRKINDDRNSEKKKMKMKASKVGARGHSVDIDGRGADTNNLVSIKDFEIPTTVIGLGDKNNDIELDRLGHSHATVSMDMIKVRKYDLFFLATTACTISNII